MSIYAFNFFKYDNFTQGKPNFSNNKQKFIQSNIKILLARTMQSYENQRDDFSLDFSQDPPFSIQSILESFTDQISFDQLGSQLKAESNNNPANNFENVQILAQNQFTSSEECSQNDPPDIWTCVDIDQRSKYHKISSSLSEQKSNHQPCSLKKVVTALKKNSIDVLKNKYGELGLWTNKICGKMKWLLGGSPKAENLMRFFLAIKELEKRNIKLLQKLDQNGCQCQKSKQIFKHIYNVCYDNEDLQGIWKLAKRGSECSQKEDKKGERTDNRNGFQGSIEIRLKPQAQEWGWKIQKDLCCLPKDLISKYQLKVHR